MAIDFSSINLEVVDINMNAKPEIYINKNGMTFSKRVLEDMGYPATVQFCVDANQKVFAIRVCKGNEKNAAVFSKPKGEQTYTLASNNKNLREIVIGLIPNYKKERRYTVCGQYDEEHRIMYYDMNSAVDSDLKLIGRWYPKNKAGETDK